MDDDEVTVPVPALPEMPTEDAAAATGDATEAAAASTAPEQFRVYAVRSPLASSNAPSTSWAIFGTLTEAQSYAAAISATPTATTTKDNDNETSLTVEPPKPFSDVMSAVTYATRNTVPLSCVISAEGAASLAAAAAASSGGAGEGEDESEGTTPVYGPTKKARGRKRRGNKKRKHDAGETSIASLLASLHPAAVGRTGSGVGSSGGGTGGGTVLRRRKPHKSWEEKLALVANLKARTGTFDVTDDDEIVGSAPVLLGRSSGGGAEGGAGGAVDDKGDGAEGEGEGGEGEGADGEASKTQKQADKRTPAEKLRRWMADQRADYRMYRLGKKTGLTEDKLVMLARIGFDFGGSGGGGVVGMPQLGAASTTTAAAASSSSTTAAASGTSEEEPPKKIRGTHVRKKLRTLTPAKQRAANQEWERMFAEFQSYRERMGHANIPTTQKTELSRWVGRQRAEYKLLREEMPSKLTTAQLMKLQDAGFVFAPRSGSYRSWEERMEQLRAFKELHGHLKVPVNDAELGTFVKAQRDSFRRRQDGHKSNLTDERYQELIDMGFVFEAGKRMTGPRGPTKTWDERFDDLLRYRAEYGHCGVPQHYPGLGYWVHAQRNGYRLLKEGKKTSMTHEKALKLADAGFIFDAKKGKRRMAGGQPAAGAAGQYAGHHGSIIGDGGGGVPPLGYYSDADQV